MIFRKLRDRIMVIEAVIDAMVELLSKKNVLNRNDIQAELLVRAGERIGKMRKRCFLHELPRDAGVKIYGFEISGENDGTAIIFEHLDGMYSLCHVDGKPEKIVHLSASTPLVKWKDGYKLDENS